LGAYGKSNEGKENVREKLISDTSGYIEQVKEFMNYIRKTEIKENTILLVDKPHMTECGIHLFDDVIKYNNEENEFIKTQISQPLIKTWSIDLVNEAKIINHDTLDAIFKDEEKGWNYFYKNYGKIFHVFSAPIFLRDNTYCLLYSEYHCGGLCGEGNCMLYKKENNLWKRLKTVGLWIN